MSVAQAGVQGGLDCVSQMLTGHTFELADRYATPMPKVAEEEETLAARFDTRLKKMGTVWK